MVRTGRPPKPKHLRRTKMVPVKLTESEWRELKRLARSVGVPLAQLMRQGARLHGRRLKGKGEPRKEDKWLAVVSKEEA